jgi:hypothetical protein
MTDFDEVTMRALFTLAKIEVLRVWRLPNGYYKDDPEANKKSPWWLVKTSAGLVEIGWRKRVIAIDWSDTSIRELITADDVTKDETMVHAWGSLKAVEYLQRLAGCFLVEHPIPIGDLDPSQ